MKIYVVGSVASGKSTLARQISQITGIPCNHLDEVVYIPDSTQPLGNRKRSVEERDALFEEILTQKDYIMEDAGRTCFINGMEQADAIVLLEVPLIVRKKRILLRWIKQNFGLEKSIYKPHIDMLKAMFQWAKDYNTDADGTKGRVSFFQNKTIILHNNRDINRYLKTLREQGYV